MKAPQKQLSLPPLIKGSASYKLFVPRNVEEKIRYLCRKFPTLEWSGVLFTTYEGNFEDGSLVIKCHDLYPMDLGTSTYTDFKMDETVAGYIAENFDLFGCDMNLIHSHNQMSAFFSGTDTSTLRSEGNDQNCFVSLIVNNAGTYCAGITRKVIEKKTIVTTEFSSKYSFFGEGERTAKVVAGADEKQEIIDNTYIEWFDLTVEVEKVDNPLAYLDTRFEEIEAKKKLSRVIPATVPDGNRSPWIPNGKNIVNPASRIDSTKRVFGNDFDEDYSFRDYLNDRKKEEEQPTLWPKEEMDAMKVVPDVEKWEPDPTVIHHLVCQMLVCSLIIDTTKLDLKQWITRHMVKKYEEIFEADEGGAMFEEWKEFIVEFTINRLNDSTTPANLYDDWDLYQSKVASAMYNELYQYPSNEYIQEYMEVLSRYIYE